MSSSQTGDGNPGGMMQRGVTRPMAERQIANEIQHEREGSSRQGRLEMHHAQTLWIYWVLILLGVWLALNPLTFGYGKATVSPSGGRDVWLSLEQRVSLMTWSDILSGLLLIVFGWRSLRPNRPVSRWVCCFVGVWITLAPVVFWAPSAAAFMNGSLVGMLVIGLTIMIPGMPNMILFMEHGTTVPKGWSYNPSSWPQRWIMILTGFLGYVVSRQLAAYQLGYIDGAWDPFFGEGTRRVLDSNMSHSLPISDAGLGTIAYTFEFMMGFMGSPQRWRTMPWMVTFFGILVIPLGLVHIFLVISQPVVVGEWCTLCLLAAAIMLPMIPLEVDEVIAMGQFMMQGKRKGDKSLWKAFWLGGAVEGEGADERTPPLESLPERPREVFLASIWGMSFPWTLVASATIGLALMFVPTAFGVTGPAADIDHVGGALVLTMATLAMGEPMRVVRYVNLLLGFGLALGPFVVAGASGFGAWLPGVLGLAVMVLALPCGTVRERYGQWQRFVR